MTIKQKVVLKKWYDENIEDIHYIFEALPDELVKKLKIIKDSETLIQDAERYIEDRLADEGF